jgi:hypothetical protein
MGQANLSKTEAVINRLLLRISAVKLEIIKLKNKRKALLNAKNDIKAL